MKYIPEKVQAGIINLSNMSIDQLLQLAEESEDPKVRDLVGCEIMYR